MDHCSDNDNQQPQQQQQGGSSLISMMMLPKAPSIHMPNLPKIPTPNLPQVGTNLRSTLLTGKKSFANTSWRVIKKAANASFGSVKTAATSLLGDRSDTQSHEEDDDILSRRSSAAAGSGAGSGANADDSASQHSKGNDSLMLWEGLDDEDENAQLSEEEQQVSHTSLDWNDSDLDKLNAHFLMDDTFHDSYSLGKSLGQGSFGSVRRCTSKEGSGNSFAVKSVPFEKYDPEEIEILRDLQECKNIVQVEEVFVDHSRKAGTTGANATEDTIMIVMEEIAGGELLERIAAKECYGEREAKVLFQTLLETVQFCHERGIAHCDIKPENIMLVSKEDDTDMKLVDFGLARRFRNPKDGTVERLMDMHGSPEYAAPEVFNRDEQTGGDGYDERCDIWSCGVVLYVLLGGYGPFEADNPEDMIKAVGEGKIKFHKKYWKDISREAKILIARMLTVDPDKRCTLEEALASPWFFEDETEVEEPLEAEEEADEEEN